MRTLPAVAVFLGGVLVGAAGVCWLWSRDDPVVGTPSMPWRNLPTPIEDVDYWEGRAQGGEYLVMQIERQGRGFLVVLGTTEKWVYAFSEVRAITAGATAIVLIPVNRRGEELILQCYPRVAELRIEDVYPYQSWMPSEGVLPLHRSPGPDHDPSAFSEAMRMIRNAQGG